MFRPFHWWKHKNDVIVTSYIKISQILKLKLKDNTRRTVHTKFYASRVKIKRIRRGLKYTPVQRVFKNLGKIGLTLKQSASFWKLVKIGQNLGLKNKSTR